MGYTTQVQRWSYLVHPVRVFLVQASYGDRAGPYKELELPPGGNEAAYEITVGVFRPSPLRLTTVLSFETAPDDPVDLLVRYAAEFEMHEAVPEPERDREWREIVLHVAPGLLYPYLRETVTNLMARGRGLELVLPLIPLPLSFEEDDFEIPPPRPSEDQAEFDLDSSPSGGAKNVKSKPRKTAKKSRKKA